MTCRRCGTDTPRLTVDQPYCPPCSRDVARLTTPAPEPAFVAPWRRRLPVKDYTYLRGHVL